MSLQLPQLPLDPNAAFPPPGTALVEPDGLLAFGGDLSPERLLNAYSNGIFPWYSDDEPILWWSPSRRAVFRTDAVRLPTRLRRSLRGSNWIVRMDTAFERVIAACASARRAGQRGTWITPSMQSAYIALHRLGHAHSVEVFDGSVPGGGRLVGGLYGLNVGRMFCGESMYSAESGASTVALVALARHLDQRGWPLVDAQVPNDHTRRLGVETWSRDDYMQALAGLLDADEPPGNWAAIFRGQPVSLLAATAPV
ncbi:leucyl/phenylalanyl-tRNA--protein transferase [Thermomonas sp.]|uniref:leucyl/phenylalanyl-tRNA--protein transferase n=1 Tax=Thermomonas sp. TaxID=1971895 RepID=UPI002489194E|nr:leucyl/phenylalanyl-tRNA--protein transferase [Thermomonas sp.]MDI1253367.1 leucyl/phenylalanyl-tRNA--protein transferase [Thermomonas sp.]